MSAPPHATTAKDDDGSTISTRSSSRTGRSLSRRRTLSTASSTHPNRRFRLTHVHSPHVDDASVYQDPWQDGNHNPQPVPPIPQLDGPSDGDPTLSTGSSTTNVGHESSTDGTSDTAVAAGADLEKAESRRETGVLGTSDQEKPKDPNLVTWDGPGDPENPKNWTAREKWVATLVVSSFTFISPVSSSMVAPALSAIEREFDIAEFMGQMVLSIFVLAYAIGPLFIGPLSELYGRVRVLQLANLVYLVFNTACGVAPSAGALVAFRFLAGLGGSAPLAIGGGVLADAWRAEERGAAIALYSLMPLLGPAIGPLCGGFITQYADWRWCFYATSVADAAIQLAGVCWLRETYPPTILQRRKNRLMKETGNVKLYTPFEDADPAQRKRLAAHLATAFVRPFRLLLTQPIVQVLALYMGFLYGSIYLVLASFPRLWHDVYGQSVARGGLHYVAIGLGFALGAQIAARLQDRIYAHLTRTRGTPVSEGGAAGSDPPAKRGRPEFRVPLMVPGAVLAPVGLLIYGWCAASGTHWIGPDAGACLFAAGSIVGFQCIQTFAVDAYARYAASAVAAVTVLRSLAGFAFPLFAPALYAAPLGYGWGNAVLALAGVVLGVPAPGLLWACGPRLRARSPFAAGD